MFIKDPSYTSNDRRTEPLRIVSVKKYPAQTVTALILGLVSSLTVLAVVVTYSYDDVTPGLRLQGSIESRQDLHGSSIGRGVGSEGLVVE